MPTTLVRMKTIRFEICNSNLFGDIPSSLRNMQGALCIHEVRRAYIRHVCCFLTLSHLGWEQSPCCLPFRLVTGFLCFLQWRLLNISILLIYLQYNYLSALYLLTFGSDLSLHLIFKNATNHIYQYNIIYLFFINIHIML